jgi:hypothetical protein
MNKLDLFLALSVRVKQKHREEVIRLIPMVLFHLPGINRVPCLHLLRSSLHHQEPCDVSYCVTILTQ